MKPDAVVSSDPRAETSLVSIRDLKTYYSIRGSFADLGGECGRNECKHGQDNGE